jgi:hypothetical protein
MALRDCSACARLHASVRPTYRPSIRRAAPPTSFTVCQQQHQRMRRRGGVERAERDIYLLRLVSRPIRAVSPRTAELRS